MRGGDGDAVLCPDEVLLVFVTWRGVAWRGSERDKDGQLKDCAAGGS